MPDLITSDDDFSDISIWLVGNKIDSWIGDKNQNSSEKKSKNIISYDKLESNDWEEIIKLIQIKRKKKNIRTEKKQYRKTIEKNP